MMSLHSAADLGNLLPKSGRSSIPTFSPYLDASVTACLCRSSSLTLVGRFQTTGTINCFTQRGVPSLTWDCRDCLVWLASEGGLRRKRSSSLGAAALSPRSLLSIAVDFAGHIKMPAFQATNLNAHRSRRRCVSMMRPSAPEFPETMLAHDLLLLLLFESVLVLDFLNILSTCLRTLVVFVVFHSRGCCS
ncbi:hypothetical protein HPB51_014229 [Rhipicephalus microplus]|uniref:Uncharacterized protein n=1 Tax=Rhipicephalus microplus TaxID=6941 RepID=A0A9J6D599_RHIMP|nr:hypothetical protein HPB51_014229 [Rhipicephalus microplus]